MPYATESTVASYTKTSCAASSMCQSNIMIVLSTRLIKFISHYPVDKDIEMGYIFCKMADSQTYNFVISVTVVTCFAVTDHSVQNNIVVLWDIVRVHLIVDLWYIATDQPIVALWDIVTRHLIVVLWDIVRVHLIVDLWNIATDQPIVALWDIVTDHLIVALWDIATVHLSTCPMLNVCSSLFSPASRFLSPSSRRNNRRCFDYKWIDHTHFAYCCSDFISVVWQFSVFLCADNSASFLRFEVGFS